MTDRPQKRRRLTLSGALTQALKAGMTPVSATQTPDGSVSLEFGNRDCKNDPKNDLDKWIAKRAN